MVRRFWGFPASQNAYIEKDPSIPYSCRIRVNAKGFFRTRPLRGTLFLVEIPRLALGMTPKKANSHLDRSGEVSKMTRSAKQKPLSLTPMVQLSGLGMTI
ncbi:MAG: hypothetical protein AAFQ87_09515 [Bacteroidota bacterium]